MEAAIRRIKLRSMLKLIDKVGERVRNVGDPLVLDSMDPWETKDLLGLIVDLGGMPKMGPEDQHWTLYEDNLTVLRQWCQTEELT